MSRPQAVIFDLGGTLVQTQDVLLTAMRETLAACGLPQPGEARLAANLGWSEPLLLRGLVPPEAEAAATSRLLPLMRRSLAEAPAIAGAGEALQRLAAQGLRLALVSGFFRATLEAILAPLGWEHLFSATVAGDEVASPRPAPDLLLAAAARLSLPPSACLAVGDSLFDLASAAACGMPFAAVLTGAQAADLARRLPAGRRLPSVAELPASALLRTGP